MKEKDKTYRIIYTYERRMPKPSRVDFSRMTYEEAVVQAMKYKLEGKTDVEIKESWPYPHANTTKISDLD